jgi:hypothetical protein
MTAMATTLGTALSNQANTERAAQAASTARLVSAIRVSNTSDRKPKVDTTNQILKAERDAHDFTKEEAFDTTAALRWGRTVVMVPPRQHTAKCDK